MAHKPLSRRDFLLVATGSTAATLAGCRPSDSPPPPTVYKSGAVVNTPVTIQGQPVEADPRYAHLTHDAPIITDNHIFYVQSYPQSGDTPSYDDVLENWRLTMDGWVENPLDLSYEAIRQLPEVETTRTLECIGNPVGGSLVGNAVWGGCWLSDLLAQAQVRPEAKQAKFYASDGYSTSVDMEWITQAGVLLAYKMNGQLLPREHGYPLRIFMPGLYGQKMPKWIERIEFIDYEYKGYWESRGWSDRGEVQTNAIIQTPPHQTRIQGQIYIQGIAFAGQRVITQVEVRVDGGEWMPAALVQGESPLVWTQWYVAWHPATTGTYEIEVRSTDETGFTQKTSANGAFGSAKPQGTNAIHRIVIQVV